MNGKQWLQKAERLASAFVPYNERDVFAAATGAGYSVSRTGGQYVVTHNATNKTQTLATLDGVLAYIETGHA